MAGGVAPQMVLDNHHEFSFDSSATTEERAHLQSLPEEESGRALLHHIESDKGRNSESFSKNTHIPAIVEPTNRSLRSNESTSGSLASYLAARSLYSSNGEDPSRPHTPPDEEQEPQLAPTKELSDPERREDEFQSHLARLHELEKSASKWSGTDRTYDVVYSDMPQELREELDNFGTLLGRGGFGYVCSITCRGIPLARKSILIDPSVEDELAKIKAEIAVNKKLAEITKKEENHDHFVKLVGTYQKMDNSGPYYHILTFPAADCDLDKFVKIYATLRRSRDLSKLPLDSQQKLLSAAALDIQDGTPSIGDMLVALKSFMNQAMGCMADALMWMHSTKVAVAHLDLKSANMLLRNGQLFVTDFGLSREQIIESAYTSSIAGLSRGYVAPELEGYNEYNPYKADVYSLGCIFLHLLSVMYGTTSTEECSKVLQGPRHKREEEIRDQLYRIAPPLPLLIIQFPMYDISRPPQELVTLVQEMLWDDHIKRPRMPAVNEALHHIGGQDSVYHSECCRRSKFIPSDEYALIPTADGKEKLRGIDRLRMDRLMPGELSTRANEMRPARRGTTGFGMAESRDEVEYGGFKAALAGWRPPISPSTTRSNQRHIQTDGQE